MKQANATDVSALPDAKAKDDFSTFPATLSDFTLI